MIGERRRLRGRRRMMMTRSRRAFLTYRKFGPQDDVGYIVLVSMVNQNHLLCSFSCIKLEHAGFSHIFIFSLERI